MAAGKRAGFSTSIDELPSNSGRHVQKVLQSGILSKPWQELLEAVAGAPIKTAQEMIAGRMALLRNMLEEHQQGYREMLNWNDFNMQVQGFAMSADADALFRLEDFAKLNEALVDAMRRWGIVGVRAAVIREGDSLRVKAIIAGRDAPNSVMFEEPPEGFPAEDLMTKLKMIQPE